MESRSSASVITGSVIFLTMTVLPESDAHTFLVLKAGVLSNSRLMVPTTASASMMAPSTIESAGTASLANADTLKLFPLGLSSTALTALEPMSRPTTALGVLRNTRLLLRYSPARGPGPRIQLQGARQTGPFSDLVRLTKSVSAGEAGPSPEP